MRSPITWQIRDDRGVLHTYSRLEAQPPPVHRRRQALILREMLTNRWYRIYFWLWTMPFVAVGVSWIIDPPDRPEWVIGSIFFAIVGTCSLLAMPMLRRMLTTRETHLATDPPVCAVCGYDMKGIPLTEDGCRVCPECGGAWKDLSGASVRGANP